MQKNPNRLTVAFVAASAGALGQYEFKTKVDVTATEVKDQCRTGTCWSYSTSSFLESEVARISGRGCGLE